MVKNHLNISLKYLVHNGSDQDQVVTQMLMAAYKFITNVILVLFLIQNYSSERKKEFWRNHDELN